MSVIVKGMKFPKGCDSCEFVQDYDEDSLCCPFRISESWYGATPGYRVEHCPLIGIPTQHGRLIDAGRLMEVIEKNSYLLKGYYNSLENGMFFTGIKQAIDEAPTIIEAEVE